MEQETLQLNTDIENILSFKNVNKVFVTDSGSRVHALKSINLEIQPGQMISIVGATGSGKTTLLNLAAGMLQATSGTTAYQDTINLKTDIAYVFQHYTLLPWRTILKNVAFGLQLRGMEKQKRNAVAMEWIDRVGLSGFEKAYPHELSGGMRQRAAIAQALAIQPKLLLMDEPFGSLDDATRSDLQNRLIDLQRQSRITVLFVTHNIDEAIYLGDRIVVMSRSPGTILEQIPVNLKRPRNKAENDYSHLFMKIRNLL